MTSALADPTYSIGGLVFGATDAAGVTWGVSTTSGWYDGAPMRLNQTVIPRGDGAYRANSYRGSRLITLTGWAVAPSKIAAQTARDALIGLYSVGTQQTLTVSDGTQVRTASVELGDAPKSAPHAAGLGFDWQLVLSAADPRKYDPQQITAVPIASSSGGLDWATTGGLDWTGGGAGGLTWGSGSSSGTVSVANAGTADTWPTFIIAGPTDGAVLHTPSITDSATGRVLAYSGDLGTGDRLTITTSRYGRSVLLNGSTDRRALLTTAQWFPIPARTTSLIQFAGNTVSPTPQLSILSANAWW